MTIIVDGHSLAYKIFYKTPLLFNSKKIPTSLIHSFLNTILTIQEKFQPNRLIVVFDSKGKTERHHMLEDYKANRQATPNDLIIQVEYLKKILPGLGIKVYAKEGIEADDIIYTLATNSNDETLIVTKDKDLAQMVSDKIKILDYVTNEVLGRDKIFEKFSLYPEQIVDFLALCGDSSDNIPGVRGIGEKTATTLLSEYGDLNNIYNNFDKIKSSWKTKLEEGKDSAYLSQQLAQLKYVENLDEAELPINGDIKRLLEELELKSILNRLFKEDIKTITFNKVANHLIIFPFADKFYTTDGKNIAILKEVDNIKPKYIFNLKELYKITKKFYDQTIDLEIVCWLTDPDFGAINLTDKDEPESIAQKIVSKKDYALNVMEQYNMWQLYWEMEHKIIKILAEMETIGIKLDPIKLKEADLKIRALIDKEKQYIEHIIGEEINLNSPKQLSKIIFEKLKMNPFKKNKTGYSTDEESLRNMIPLNIQYEDLLKAILRHREYSKLVSTYTSKLSEYINPSTGRIHTVFKQTGTATGRLSSQNPNLQNIPQKGDLGAEIRGSFVSEDGYSFVSFDYSQIELRILAEISGDENLKNAFINDLDIHNLTAMSILGIKEDEITKDIRRIAKAVNFGIVYGLSPYGLSRDVGISVGEAKKFIDKYFETYPKVKEYMNNIVINAQKNGYVETLFGRKRFVKDLNSSNSILRQRNERIAINSPIQGTAADIIKMAMIKCYDYLNNNIIDGKMILQIHDELVFEINDKDIDKAIKNIKLIMENVCKLNVPLKTSYSVSKNLGELK